MAVIWCLSSTPFMGMFFAPLKLNLYFPVLTFNRGVWSMLIIKDGGISCPGTNPDMFLWKVNFSLAKNWWEGSTFPVVPLCLLHVFFSNTPLTHLSVNTRSPPYSFKRLGLFALTTPVTILMSYACWWFPSPSRSQRNVFNFFYHTRVCQVGSSNSLDNGLVTIIAILLQGVNCGSDRRIFRIFSRELFNCWNSDKIPCIQANFSLNLCRNFYLMFFRPFLCLLHLLFRVSKLRRSNIFCHWS